MNRSANMEPTLLPSPVPLWSPEHPNPPGGRCGEMPFLLPFLPAERHGRGRPAVVVTPGGGYQGICLTHEGVEVGGWLQAHGFAAFIVRYRVAPHRHPVPSQDARRAIRVVRSRAAEIGRASCRGRVFAVV